MYRIKDTVVDAGVCEIQFACDLTSCKGACCTMPGPRGAPLLDSEVEEIRKWYPVIRGLLPAHHVSVIEADGLVQGNNGDHTTTCVDERACVFVYFDHGIAKCAFERAFQDGSIPWQKPLSCHLFPIRVRYGALKELRFEYIPECRPALDRGTTSGTVVGDFLQTPLTRAFGADWFAELQRISREHRAQKDLR